VDDGGCVLYMPSRYAGRPGREKENWLDDDMFICAADPRTVDVGVARVREIDLLQGATPW